MTGSTLNRMIGRIAPRIAMAECRISKGDFSDLWGQCCDTTLLDAAGKASATQRPFYTASARSGPTSLARVIPQ